MKRVGVDALLVASTDRYLNEYVPTETSSRVWISGFTGSMGEVVIAAHRAYLIVDGRYWLQAEKEVDADLYEVVRVPHATSIEEAVVDVLKELAGRRRQGGLSVGYEAERTTPRGLERLVDALGEDATFQPTVPSLVDRIRGSDRPEDPEAGLRLVDEERIGITVGDKLDHLAEWLRDHQLDALLVQRLDDIAYLTNLRGTQLPFQATFKALALVTPQTLFVALDVEQVPPDIKDRRRRVQFVNEEAFWALFGPKPAVHRVGYDVDHNTVQARLMIERAHAEPVASTSPVPAMKSNKSAGELKSMKDAFRRADQVVHAVIQWACRQIQTGQRLTEASFARRVESTFRAHGAVGLSFKIISAAGKSGAIIHYSDPSPRRVLKEGQLMLLDTGAYFADGYATDLTRTFLLGGSRVRASDAQRRYFTLVLRGALAGMRAVFPEGTRATQIDALVRAPLWAEGLNYAHGTGHGVGINVHEFPPRIGPGADGPLEPGQVFSVEPGIYLPSFGGVRIENLCTVEPAPGHKGFLRIVPLTFCPLDKRLIEPKLLTAGEKAWLRAYDKRFQPATIVIEGEATPPRRARRRAVASRRATTPGRRSAARRPR